jgi:N-acetylglucosaminyl-diphospho-decaprenol L-rhamnosyltransferase
MNAKLLSVIIVTYNSRNVIAPCLNSIKLFNDIGEGLEVIVVDNSPSNGDTFSFITDNYRWVKIIPNPLNKGFGQGNNVGALQAQGKYLLFLNPDTELIEPIFRFSVNQFEKSPDLSAFGMLLITPEGYYSNSFGIMPEKKTVIPTIFFLPIIKCGVMSAGIYPYGADLFVRKALFLDTGGFDENIFLCYEEPDLIRRMKGQVKIFKKKIIHIGEHTTSDSRKRLDSFLLSERYYFNKYGLNYKKYVQSAKVTLSLKCIFNRILFRQDPLSSYLINQYKSM